MNPDELQRVVALARIVLQVDGIPGREPYATSHLVSTEDLHASVTVPTTPDAPWRIELSEADTDLLVGEGATDTAALADLRAKVEVAAETVVAAIGESLACLRGVRPGKRPKHRYSDAAITDALRQSGGNMLRAAKALGCADVCIRLRLKRNPALMPDGLVARKRGRPSLVANDGDKAVA